WVDRWVDGGSSGGGGGGDGDGGVGWFQCSRGRSLSHTDDSPRRCRRRDGSRNRRRKRARGKYGRAVAARRSARRFGKLDSPATNVIRSVALPLARHVGISGFLIGNRRETNRRGLWLSLSLSISHFSFFFFYFRESSIVV
ncbi:hypothetical protein ALC62_07731, partial [Cyphomyrmex costatus]